MAVREQLAAQHDDICEVDQFVRHPETVPAPGARKPGSRTPVDNGALGAGPCGRRTPALAPTLSACPQLCRGNFASTVAVSPADRGNRRLEPRTRQSPPPAGRGLRRTTWW